MLLTPHRLFLFFWKKPHIYETIIGLKDPVVTRGSQGDIWIWYFCESVQRPRGYAEIGETKKKDVFSVTDTEKHYSFISSIASILAYCLNTGLFPQYWHIYSILAYYLNTGLLPQYWPITSILAYCLNTGLFPQYWPISSIHGLFPQYNFLT